MVCFATTDNNQKFSTLFGPFPSISFAFNLLQHILLYLMDSTSALFSAHLFIYSGAVCTALICHLLVECKQTSLQLRSLFKSNQLKISQTKERKETKQGYNYGFWPSLDCILRANISTFQATFTVDAVVGHLLSGFLAVTTPISAFILMEVSLGLVSDGIALFILLAPPAFQVFSLSVHFYIGLLSKRLHASAKLLFSLNAHRLVKVGNFRAKMRLEATIARLNERKQSGQYGITYGHFRSLVSLQSFGKVR